MPKTSTAQYKKWIGDVTILGVYGDAGEVKIVVRMITGHCFYWVSDQYCGRVFSINPFRDSFRVVREDGDILIKSSWLPWWTITVIKNSVVLGVKTYYFGPLVFYMGNVLSIAVFLFGAKILSRLMFP